jgi:hypothetical protein
VYLLSDLSEEVTWLPMLGRDCQQVNEKIQNLDFERSYLEKLNDVKARE